MRVLMNEVGSGQGRTAAAVLRDRGHLVVTCSSDRDGVPCASLRGEDCPLESTGVDVAVQVDSGRRPQLDGAGLLCALRRSVPLVVLAREAGVVRAPFDGVASAVCVLDDLAGTLDQVVDSPLVRHGAAAEQAANLAFEGTGGHPWHAVARRGTNSIRVELSSSEPVGPELQNKAAVRAVQAIRKLDRGTSVIDVSTHVPAEEG